MSTLKAMDPTDENDPWWSLARLPTKELNRIVEKHRCRCGHLDGHHVHGEGLCFECDCEKFKFNWKRK